VAANRDERLDRPAVAATVLQAGDPRILGGRDGEAGGTWLAVNEHGLVAGLTNRPALEGRDPSKRSRGELPLALAGHRRAEEAVEEFVHRFCPSDYNPSWLLVGDRRSLFYLDMTEGEEPHVRELPPGLHVLENNPIEAGSPKQRHVLGLLRGFTPSEPTNSPLGTLDLVLADHSVPEVHGKLPDGVSESVLAACVHTDRYGTRSAAIVQVPDDDTAKPRLAVADGHPCTAQFEDRSGLWRD